MFNGIYKNKKIFLTGHSGFKGSWLALWLTKLGAEVYGYSLEPDTAPSMFKDLNIQKQIKKSIIGNILDVEKLQNSIKGINPDIVFHLAAQPLVRLSYSKPKLTYETNVIGTLNLLEVARNCSSVRAFINVTTDKCYENKEIHQGYREDDRLGGYDMYSSSKACSEILSASYRHSFLQGGNTYLLATARAGNVIGGGDWACDRLVPDCIKNIAENKTIEIRNPLSIRPWQFVLEPLAGYLLLGQKLLEGKREFAQSFNFGPKEEERLLNVSEVAQKICEYYGKGKYTVNKTDKLHEAEILMLNIKKAQNLLNWNPVYNIETAIKTTVLWYKNYYETKDMIDFTYKQIEEYEGCITWEKQNLEIK